MPKSSPSPSHWSERVRHLAWIAALVLLMWLVFFFDWLSGHRLSDFGAIVPRTLHGLWGVPFSAFLHGDLAHLAYNTVPFAILGWLVISGGTQRFLAATGLIIVLGGLGVWLFARSAAHLGASGLIFGYFGYLLARALFERSASSILFAFAAIFLYGGIWWGLLPTRGPLSWEAHLFGAIAGVTSARWLK